MWTEKPLEISYAIVAGDKIVRLVEAYQALRASEPTLPWPDDFQDAFQLFSTAHTQLKSAFATSKDVPLRIIDRASDRALGGLASILTAFQQIFAQAPLPQTPEQSSLAADAALLSNEFFPQGVSPIIHSDHQGQWVQTEALLQAHRQTPALQDASKRLGLEAVFAWLQTLHHSYGAKLGITGTQPDTELEHSLVSWHQACGELHLVASYHVLRGTKTERLLALVRPPYQEELQRQAADRAAARSKKEDTKKSNPDKPS